MNQIVRWLVKFQWSHFFSEMDRQGCRDIQINLMFQWSHFFSEMDSGARRTTDQGK